MSISQPALMMLAGTLEVDKPPLILQLSGYDCLGSMQTLAMTNSPRAHSDIVEVLV